MTTLSQGTLEYSGATFASTSDLTAASGTTLSISSAGLATSASVAAGRFIVNSGATLNGTGTITLTDTATSLTSVSVFGAFTPGTDGTIGTLGLNASGGARSALAFEGTGTLKFDLGAGLTSDRLSITGHATFADVFFNNNTINFNDKTVGNTLSNGSYLLVSGDANTNYSGLTVSGTAITAGLTIGTGLSAYTPTSLSLIGNNIYLNIGAIPEPSTFAALAGLGALGLGATRRRRLRA